MSPDVDARTGLFSEACWAFVRGETAAKPTAAAFNLHPFLAEAVGRMIGVDIERRAHRQTAQKLDLL